MNTTIRMQSGIPSQQSQLRWTGMYFGKFVSTEYLATSPR